MQVEIKHLDVLSVAKVSFVIYAALGIIIGVLYLIFALVFSGFLGYGEVLKQGWPLRVAATGLGILLVPLLALVYGFIGAVAGLIFALIYNLISKAVGGVKLTLTGDTADVLTAGDSESKGLRL